MGDDLKRRIDAARSAHVPPDADTNGPASSKAMGMGFRMASEFVCAILVGAGIGWGLDRWLGTAPWLMLLMFGCGFAAGILNVVRVAQAVQTQPGDAPDADEGA